VRFDMKGEEAQVSVNIAPVMRGRSYGIASIFAASQRLFRESAVRRIYANIKRHNIVSQRAFEMAGYHNAGSRIINGHRAMQMVFDSAEAVVDA